MTIPTIEAKDIPVYQPETRYTDSGTKYFVEPGVVLTALTHTDIRNMEEFVAGFATAGDDDYVSEELYDMSSAEQIAKVAGQLCYLSFGNKRTHNDRAIDYFDNIKAQKHGSVLEHASATFLLYGVSRSFTHEIVRHRAGFAYSQVSQRYVGPDALRFVERPEFIGDPELHKWFCSRIDINREMYKAIIEHTIAKMAKEDQDSGMTKLKASHRRKIVQQAARALLPNETEAPIMVTGNMRAWRHFLEMRGSIHAEPEIRRVAIAIMDILQYVMPLTFQDYYLLPEPDGMISYSIGTRCVKV